jgi:hypothetical protein
VSTCDDKYDRLALLNPDQFLSDSRQFLFAVQDRHTPHAVPLVPELRMSQRLPADAWRTTGPDG